ncbi:DDE-type integrase/transposase/recombinase, partial [Acinetobacter baumannii]|uniref:DDE-type integrase/transposase/recombinase n=1 Tax=Acinetobacter baumannii TaxID=470 RepID=UPI00148F0765
MDIFSIDKQNFLSLVDSLSKHALLIPIQTKNLVDVRTALSQYFASFGIPQEIVTDHETTFRSIQLRTFLSNLECSLNYASSSES